MAKATDASADERNDGDGGRDESLLSSIETTSAIVAAALGVEQALVDSMLQIRPAIRYLIAWRDGLNNAEDDDGDGDGDDSGDGDGGGGDGDDSGDSDSEDYDGEDYDGEDYDREREEALKSSIETISAIVAAALGVEQALIDAALQIRPAIRYLSALRDGLNAGGGDSES